MAETWDFFFFFKWGYLFESFWESFLETCLGELVLKLVDGEY
jgi:hypothetical protein